MGRRKKQASLNKKANDKEKREKKKEEIKSETLKGVLSIVTAAIGVILFLSAFNLSGKFGNALYGGLSTALGIGYYLLPLSAFIFSFALYNSSEKHIGPLKTFSLLMFFITTLAFVELLFPGSGGFTGAFIAKPVLYAFDKIAGAILLSALSTASLFLIFDSHPGRVIRNLKKKEKDTGETISDTQIKTPIQDSKEEKEEQKQSSKKTSDTKKELNLISSIKSASDKFKETVDIEVKTQDTGNYKPPSLRLLNRDSGKPSVGDVKANANAIKRTLQNFGIPVEMDEIVIGPTITRYALKPAEGVRLSKILGLQKDLELALDGSMIRIEAPIPGKSLVGIEVPNKVKTVLGLGTILSSSEFKNTSMILPMALGRDITGASHFADLASAPHMLIAGATGAGKSVTLHNLLISLLYKYGPDKLRFIMMDPKKVELPLYNGIPHLLTPAITEHKKMVLTLKWLINEMENRYDILKEFGVQNLQDYHAMVSDKDPEAMPLPYIVTVIDELAEIMQLYPKEFEDAVVRLTQKSRAVGIHLILATQRPDVKTITGLIKANIPTRVALKTRSQVDSRTILDQAGAEKLLGKGDMLYLSSSMSKPIRLQSAFVSTQELKSVIKAIKDNFSGELTDEINLEDMGADNVAFTSGNLFDDDERNSEEYQTAKQLVIESQRASTSFLQRKMRIGFNKASRFMDLMEEEGVVGPANGAKPREILISASEDITATNEEFSNIEQEDEKEENLEYNNEYNN